ncbi:MAG: hypothetical protein GY745_09620, partial [Actinomycetia bacterium]|nr:hypothetical protein [Actinomycetes bacterium]
MSTGALDRRVAAARHDPSQADVDELVSGTQRRIMIGELTAAVLVAYGLYISISIGERWGLAAGIGLIAPQPRGGHGTAATGPRVARLSALAKIAFEEKLAFDVAALLEASSTGHTDRRLIRWVDQEHGRGDRGVFCDPFDWWTKRSNGMVAAAMVREGVVANVHLAACEP